MDYGCKIESIGVKLPDNEWSTNEIEKELHSLKSLKLEFLTGISNRRVCNKNEDSLSLAVDAIKDCLKFSEIKANEIEMIISCSISKYIDGLNYYYEPALSLMIKDKIGNKKALCFDVTNACAGMITGIHIAKNFISQGKIKNCLIVSGEYITSVGKNALKNVTGIRHPEMASLTVGDAGAAVILSRTNLKEEILWTSEMTTLSYFSDLCIGCQSRNSPGAVMKTDLKTIHEVSLRNIPSVVEKALRKAGIHYRDINYFIPHQTAKISITAGAKILTKYFKEKPGEVVINLSETGNTASTTHFVALYQYLNNKKFKKGDKIMLVSFASGLVTGSVIFSVNGIINRYGNNN